MAHHARVELIGSLSLTRGGETFVKGVPKFVPAEQAAYFQNVGGFAVTIIDAPAKQRGAAPPPPPVSEDDPVDEAAVDAAIADAEPEAPRAKATPAKSSRKK